MKNYDYKGKKDQMVNDVKNYDYAGKTKDLAGKLGQSIKGAFVGKNDSEAQDVEEAAQ